MMIIYKNLKVLFYTLYTVNKLSGSDYGQIWLDIEVLHPSSY